MTRTSTPATRHPVKCWGAVPRWQERGGSQRLGGTRLHGAILAVDMGIWHAGHEVPSPTASLRHGSLRLWRQARSSWSATARPRVPVREFSDEPVPRETRRECDPRRAGARAVRRESAAVDVRGHLSDPAAQARGSARRPSARNFSIDARERRSTSTRSSRSGPMDQAAPDRSPVRHRCLRAARSYGGNTQRTMTSRSGIAARDSARGTAQGPGSRRSPMRRRRRVPSRRSSAGPERANRSRRIPSRIGSRRRSCRRLARRPWGGRRVLAPAGGRRRA